MFSPPQRQTYPSRAGSQPSQGEGLMPETDVVVEDANSPASYLPAGERQPSPPSGMAQMDPSSEVVRQRVTEIDTVASTAPDHSISQSYNAVTTGLSPNGSREPSAEQRSVPPRDQALNPPSDQALNVTNSLPNQREAPVPDRHSLNTVPTETPTVRNPSRTWKIWCLVAVVIALAISVPVGWSLRLRDFTVPEPPANAQDTQLQLSATLVAIDPVAQTMTIEWEILYYCGFNVQFPPVPPCDSIDIYFDQNLIQAPQNQATATNNVPTTPVFHYNGTTANDQDLITIANSPFFRTQISLFKKGIVKSQGMTLQAYPFDQYEAEIFVFARNSTTGGLVNISLTQVDGIAPGFFVNSVSEPSIDVEGSLIILLGLNVTRGIVVRLYAITIIIAIWLVTLILLAATVAAVILGRVVAKEILTIPVATLFAFTSLRGTLPGAPTGFGATLDFVGILPCLAILTFCAVFMLSVILFRTKLGEKGVPMWKRASPVWKRILEWKRSLRPRQVPSRPLLVYAATKI